MTGRSGRKVLSWWISPDCALPWSFYLFYHLTNVTCEFHMHRIHWIISPLIRTVIPNTVTACISSEEVFSFYGTVHIKDEHIDTYRLSYVHGGRVSVYLTLKFMRSWKFSLRFLRFLWIYNFPTHGISQTPGSNPCHAMQLKADFVCSTNYIGKTSILEYLLQVKPLFKVLAITGTNRTAFLAKIKDWTSTTGCLSQPVIRTSCFWPNALSGCFISFCISHVDSFDHAVEAHNVQ